MNRQERRARGIRRATGAEQARMMDRILDEGIKPHAAEIAEICTEGRIAAVVFQPAEGVEAMLFELGWDGEAAVFEPNAEVMQTMARNCAARGDHATPRWIHSDRMGRIFLAAYGGTLLVNFEPGRGFSIEPESTDAEWMS